MIVSDVIVTKLRCLIILAPNFEGLVTLIFRIKRCRGLRMSLNYMRRYSFDKLALDIIGALCSACLILFLVGGAAIRTAGTFGVL